MQVVESPTLAAGNAIMGDFRAAMRLFSDGRVQLAADPFTEFRTYRTNLRAEGRFAVGFLAPHALRIVDIQP